MYIYFDKLSIREIERVFLKLSPCGFNIPIMFKQTLLNDFIAQYRHLPEQGTDEWKVLRKGFIGGSELSTVLKQNKNKSVNKLVLEKLGFDRFTGNAITHWGNVFEELIRLYCEDAFSCSIRETGSIPYTEGKLSYSPDGLALVPTHKLVEHFGVLADGLDDTSPAQLVLFEFKCPHSRLPTTDIPDHYWPQVNVGMNIIDIMETGIFVQAVYRRCSFNALKHDKSHNPYGHFKRADTTNPPIECGFMVIYVDDATEYHDGLAESFLDVGEVEEMHLNNGDTVFDLGNMRDPALFEEVLGNCVNKSFKVEYCFRHLYNQQLFADDSYVRGMHDESLQYRATEELKRQTQKHSHIIGILPYKMMSVYVTPVAKNPNYIEETDAHGKASAVLQCIEDHRQFDDKATAQKSIRKYKL